MHTLILVFAGSAFALLFVLSVICVFTLLGISTHLRQVNERLSDLDETARGISNQISLVNQEVELLRKAR